MDNKKSKLTKTEKSRGDKGISAEKDEFSEWFTQIMLKADLADYSAVSGCIVYKPTAYALWENIVKEVDSRFKKIGVKNVYFPLLIPERLLMKEKEHVEGFSPEVAWVTHAGDTELKERLAIRPTSEAIMYDSYSKWIRSWRDLPLQYNQWNNVVRWEFKHPVPFLRGREFLWNEGHSAYATKEAAEAEREKILGIYQEVCEKYLALPSLIGKKSDKEKFAGAVYSASMEFYMPNGKAIQGPDFHFDGQNFAKAYDIKFLDKDGAMKYVWQNTWAISTRMLGVMFAVHSDAKGLVVPPAIAPNKVVIIPIVFEDSKEKVLKTSDDVKKILKDFSPLLDDRDAYKPGYKFNEYELKGIPIRIEIGPKDVEKNVVVLARRDTGAKEVVKISELKETVAEILEEMQKNLFKKAEALLKNSIAHATTISVLKEKIAEKKIVFAPLCNSRTCEDNLKSESGGAKVLNIPEAQPKELSKSVCVICKKKADYFAYVGKSY